MHAERCSKTKFHHVFFTNNNKNRYNMAGCGTFFFLPLSNFQSTPSPIRSSHANSNDKDELGVSQRQWAQGRSQWFTKANTHTMSCCSLQSSTFCFYQQGAALLLGHRDPEFCSIVGGCGACWRFILWLITVVVVVGTPQTDSGNKDVN